MRHRYGSPDGVSPSGEREGRGDRAGEPAGNGRKSFDAQRLAGRTTRVQSSPAPMFDSWAAGYDESVLQAAYAGAHHAVLTRAAGLCAHPSKIVDIGCGTGHLLMAANRIFPRAHLVGVDPSAGMLSIAATRLPSRCRLVQASAECLPFRDGTFDLVTTTYAIRHWSDAHIGLRQIARVLAPDGLVGLADAFPAERSAANGWAKRHTVAAPLPRAVAEALRAAGLRLLDAATIGGCGVITATTVAVAAHGARGGPTGWRARWYRGVSG